MPAWSYFYYTCLRVSRVLAPFGRGSLRAMLATAPPATVRASLQVRHLLEGAGGVFTGSRYKDLQIQSLGLWGEIRDWRDGSTIVQKTHDAEGGHVTQVGDCARNERPR